MKKILLSHIISSLESGSRPKGGVSTTSGDIPSLGAEHLNDQSGFNFNNLKLIPQDFYKSLKKGRIKPNDILIVKDGATTGKVGFVNKHFPYADAAINEHLFRVEVNNKKADPSFVFRFLNTGFGQHQILKDFRGATVGGISRCFIEKVEIPYPSITEQKRIADILDKADAIRRKRRQAIQLTEEFLRSVFLDMFGDPKINPKNWKKKKIKQLGKVVTGNTPSRKFPENFGSYIEWIKSDNINTPYHILTKAEEGLSETGMRIGRTVPARSTLVTCIAGTPDCIGNAALSDRLVAFNQQTNAIVPFDNVDPYFLYMLVIISKKIIQRASTNSMKGMVSKGIFQEIELISPPYDLQKKFGGYFCNYLSFLNKQELHFSESNILFNSLCQKAFRGEL